MSEPTKRKVKRIGDVVSLILMAGFILLSLEFMRSGATADSSLSARDRQVVRDMQVGADIATLRERIVVLEKIAEKNQERIASLQQSVSSYAGWGGGFMAALAIFQTLGLISKRGRSDG